MQPEHAITTTATKRLFGVGLARQRGVGAPQALFYVCCNRQHYAYHTFKLYTFLSYPSQDYAHAPLRSGSHAQHSRILDNVPSPPYTCA